MIFSDDPEIVVDYDYTGVSSGNMKDAKVLFETIGEVIGRSTRAILSLKSNFYELGGNSLNSIYTVAKLKDKGYQIDITAFITAKNLEEMLSHLTEIENCNDQDEGRADMGFPVEAIQLASHHKEVTIE